MSRELQEQVCLAVAPSPCPGSCPAPAQQQAGRAGPRLEPRQEASAEPEQVRESLWGGDSPGAWLEVLVGGGVFCSLKGHPGRVGREWWLEEELSLDMMGSWRCRWNHRKWPSRELCCHSCLPSDSECRSSWAAQQLANFQARTKHPPLQAQLLSTGAAHQRSPAAARPPGTRCLSPSTGPGHGPQSLTSRNHCSASYRHVQVIWGRQAVPPESGWLICRTLGQNEPGEVQGVGSSLQPHKEVAEQRWALMRSDLGHTNTLISIG